MNNIIINITICYDFKDALAGGFMNTKYLEYIIALSEDLNITKAAKRLNISQPALSNYLNLLESKLDIKLFIKHKKKLTLTVAGKIYMDYAIKICNIKNQTYQTLIMLNNQHSQTLTIGATSIRGSLIFSRVFGDFYSKYPYVNIQIKERYTKTLMKKLQSGEIDFVIGTYLNKDDKNFEYTTIGKEEIVLAVPSFSTQNIHANFLEKKELPVVDIREFKDIPFIIGGGDTNLRAIADQIFSSANINPTVIFESNNTALLSNILHHGNGIGAGFIPKSYIENGLGLNYYSLYSRPHYYVGIFHKKNRILNANERYLLYLLIKNELISKKIIIELNDFAKSLLEEFGGLKLWT